MGNMARDAKKLLRTFALIGSTFLRAFAESTVEAAHMRAVRIARASPSMIIHTPIRSVTLRDTVEYQLQRFPLINLVAILNAHRG